ncbi:hypothetical protein ASU3_05685 [Actinobacillus suis]|uniref:Uncharacterized protein n=1 Tax=Actinobacillus suis H91-0380 TaxID=696748 RepID=K0GC39_ACTSU|nr:hypothetical protein ASU2_05835 [Actinobacillus suis H91-0380]AIJ31444.1 hypothetical protein ASU1_05905 [Actinobacillus suis ATCC 33415]OQS58113.1 hypothetical protein ASU5_06710 [Actinobacillus suis]OQS58848.1 hypothetical protein ASU3_05685 [Actinobacillus suis]OQS61738.1 hypothetical protein ASU4_00790 [Actinobacillus suis]
MFPLIVAEQGIYLQKMSENRPLIKVTNHTFFALKNHERIFSAGKLISPEVRGFRSFRFYY